MNTHVFVVDSNTFKVHLEYMFAGTGAGEKRSPFLMDSNISFNWHTEQNLVAMIADISRIRPGDNIIFYLQAFSNHPGMFFGVFKADSFGFFDENDENNYLVNNLRKGLSFRIRISPVEVFPKGVSEHEYLDNLEGKDRPCQLCWSLIYRKLKGNRGCTMLTSYEYEDLLEKLKKKNNNITLSGRRFSFDSQIGEIINIDHFFSLYEGRTQSLDIEQRMIYKYNRGNAFETHLQAFVMQNFDKNRLKDFLLTLDNGNVWVGNEVSCGVGMQRIDALFIEENKSTICVKVIELKDEEPYDYILDEQLSWYLKWISQFMIPNLLKNGKIVKVYPCILAKQTNDERIINRIRESLFVIDEQNVIVEPTEYIGFNIIEDEISFIRIV